MEDWTTFYFKKRFSNAEKLTFWRIMRFVLWIYIFYGGKYPNIYTYIYIIMYTNNVDSHVKIDVDLLLAVSQRANKFNSSYRIYNFLIYTSWSHFGSCLLTVLYIYFCFLEGKVTNRFCGEYKFRFKYSVVMCSLQSFWKYLKKKHVWQF